MPHIGISRFLKGEFIMGSYTMEQQDISSVSAGISEVPEITLLGALADSQGASSLGLSAVSSPPIFAILYNGI
jgi:hypothetical protein